MARLPAITDAQVVQFLDYWWIRDKTVPFERYLGNPLKRLDRDSYALYTGEKAVHWIDGRMVGENRRYVPAMAAQLNLGIWLPEWAGPGALGDSRSAVRHGTRVAVRRSR